MRFLIRPNTHMIQHTTGACSIYNPLDPLSWMEVVLFSICTSSYFIVTDVRLLILNNEILGFMSFVHTIEKKKKLKKTFCNPFMMRLC